MKHLKKFESLYDPTCKRCYWYVPTKDGKLSIALKKIGAPQRYIDKMNSRVESLPEYIYVGEYMEDGNWAWDGTMQNFGDSHSTYMGELKIDDSEVSSDKFNL
jgi:hypothetical protein